MVIGESKFKITKLNQQIELLNDDIEEQDRKQSHNRKMLDEKVLAHIITYTVPYPYIYSGQLKPNFWRIEKRVH